MRWKKNLTMVEAHAEGEIGRVGTGGVMPGASMLDRMNYINEVDDSLRRFCGFGPRGCPQMSTNLLFAPSRPNTAGGTLAAIVTSPSAAAG
ncbi:MAG: proline racemase family protein [Hyphomicrobiaceae bacterium]